MKPMKPMLALPLIILSIVCLSLPATAQKKQKAETPLKVFKSQDRDCPAVKGLKMNEVVTAVTSTLPVQKSEGVVVTLPDNPDSAAASTATSITNLAKPKKRMRTKRVKAKTSKQVRAEAFRDLDYREGSGVRLGDDSSASISSEIIQYGGGGTSQTAVIRSEDARVLAVGTATITTLDASSTTIPENADCTQQNVIRALALAVEGLEDPNPDPEPIDYRLNWHFITTPSPSFTIKSPISNAEGIRREAELLREQAANLDREAEEVEQKSSRVRFVLAVQRNCARISQKK